MINENDIPAKLTARIDRRDKKRHTKMVVDGAGTKRIVKALADRRWEATNNE